MLCWRCLFWDLQPQDIYCGFQPLNKIWALYRFLVNKTMKKSSCSALYYRYVADVCCCRQLGWTPCKLLSFAQVFGVRSWVCQKRSIFFELYAIESMSKGVTTAFQVIRNISSVHFWVPNSSTEAPTVCTEQTARSAEAFCHERPVRSRAPWGQERLILNAMRLTVLFISIWLKDVKGMPLSSQIFQKTI